MTATARRGHGEGSVYRDAANGTWVGAISLGWRPDGSRIRRKVTGRTKTEVREKLKKLQAEADAGLKTSASYTVAKAVDDWAAEALDGLADKTVRSHVDLLRPVTMLTGNVPLRDLTALAEFRLTPLSVAVPKPSSSRVPACTPLRGHTQAPDAAEMVSRREDHEPSFGTEKRS
jgi:hypothetical protein